MNDMSGNPGGAASLPAVASGTAAPAGAGFDIWRYRLGAIFNQPAILRTLPLLGLLGVVAAAALVWTTLRSAPQRDLFRGLPDADKGAVVDVLGKNNIPYAFDNSSGSITVSEDDYFKAKMMLAAEGLPKSAPDGNAMIDSLPMGASRAVEGEKLRSAREMDQTCALPIKKHLRNMVLLVKT